jgi:hypothetical protein
VSVWVRSHRFRLSLHRLTPTTSRTNAGKNVTVHQAEDGGVRSDSQRQHHQRRQSEGRHFPEDSKRAPQVQEKCAHAGSMADQMPIELQKILRKKGLRVISGTEACCRVRYWDGAFEFER